MGNVSLRPADYAEGGGLLDDADVTISDARFIMGDYGGAAQNKSPMCRVMMADAEGQEHEQFLSVGSADDFQPDETGKGLDKVGKKAALTKSSNFGMFMDSLVTAGFPANKIEPDDITSIVGTDVHVLRKAIERKGLKDAKAMTVLLVSKINKLPWEKAGAKTGTAKAGAKAEAPANEELDTQVTDIIMTVLAANEGTVTKSKLLGEASKLDEVKAAANKKDVIKRLTDDSFLKGNANFKYENGTISL
jgi:hypothetical protein